MGKTDEKIFDIGLSFSVPEEHINDPFVYREQVVELMVEAGWPVPHSAGFGCGFGDLAWTVSLDEADLIDSLAILVDRVYDEMESLRIKVQMPVELPDGGDLDDLTPEQRLINAVFDNDDSIRLGAAMEVAATYKPTMDPAVLHCWAQSVIEKLYGEPFNPREFL